jgi:hypothetical protein
MLSIAESFDLLARRAGEFAKETDGEQ